MASPFKQLHIVQIFLQFEHKLNITGNNIMIPIQA